MKIASLTVTETKAKVLAAYTDTTNITDVAVNNIPDPETQIGKNAELFINPLTGELFYEYTDKPMSETEQVLHQRISDLETLLLQQEGVI
jgi:hypothetical protein